MRNYPKSIKEIQWLDDYYGWHEIPKPCIPTNHNPANRIKIISTIFHPVDEKGHICGNPKYIPGDPERDDLESNLISVLRKISEQKTFQ